MLYIQTGQLTELMQLTKFLDVTFSTTPFAIDPKSMANENVVLNINADVISDFFMVFLKYLIFYKYII